MRAKDDVERYAQSLNEWYFVEWDDEGITRRVHPPGREPWSDRIEWNMIQRICYEVRDDFISDCIFIFTTNSEESYAIPTEAHGAPELWGEIINRKLFSPKLAIRAMTTGFGIFCWPEEKT